MKKFILLFLFLYPQIAFANCNPNIKGLKCNKIISTKHTNIYFFEVGETIKCFFNETGGIYCNN